MHNRAAGQPDKRSAPARRLISSRLSIRAKLGKRLAREQNAEMKSERKMKRAKFEPT